MSNQLGQIYGTVKNAETYIVLNSQNVELSGNVYFNGSLIQNVDICGNLNISGGLAIDNSYGTTGQVLMSRGSQASPIWGRNHLNNLSDVVLSQIIAEGEILRYDSAFGVFTNQTTQSVETTDNVQFAQLICTSTIETGGNLSIYDTLPISGIPVGLPKFRIFAQTGVIHAAPNTNTIHEIGQLRLGNITNTNNVAGISQFNRANGTDFALTQNSAGQTTLNAAANQSIRMGVGNGNPNYALQINSNGVDLLQEVRCSGLSGTLGHVLTSNGANAPPSWQSAGGIVKRYASSSINQAISSGQVGLSAFNNFVSQGISSSSSIPFTIQSGGAGYYQLNFLLNSTASTQFQWNYMRIFKNNSLFQQSQYYTPGVTFSRYYPHGGGFIIYLAVNDFISFEAWASASHTITGYVSLNLIS